MYWPIAFESPRANYCRFRCGLISAKPDLDDQESG